MTSAVSAKGTFLIWNYHKIAEAVNITGLSESVTSISVSNHDSPDAYMESIPGMVDGGELSIEANFIAGDTNGQIAFHTDMQARTGKAVLLVMPMAVGQTLSFNALASNFGLEFPIDGAIKKSGALKVSGKPTLLTIQSTGISALEGIEETDTTALSINEAIAAGTYEYTCTVDTASNWVKLTVTAVSHSLWIAGESETSGVQTGEIALGAAGTDTDILIIAQEAGESPRLYRLRVTRESS